MPLGEAIAELVFQVFGQFLIDSVVGKAIIWSLRLPGALIGWAIWRQRTWAQVWKKGNGFLQATVGIVVHFIWVMALVVACQQ